MVSGLTNAVAITAGGIHSCAVLANGTAKCWGYNDYGELGNGTTTNSSTPVVVSGLTNAVAITAGCRPFVCVVGERDRQVLGRQRRRRVGERHHDQLVDAGRGERSDQRGRDLGGRLHSCALLANGTAKCWGYNGSGAVGERHHDRLVDAGRGERPDQRGRDRQRAVTIRVRCLANGTAKCWGDNADGQLGNGTTTNSSTPVTVTGL